MAFDPSAFNPSGFAAAPPMEISDLGLKAPMFSVEHVQLQFPIASAFAAVQVANNVLILACVSGRILRIDLANPRDVEDIDLPKKPSEVGVIRKVFLDPKANHLIITTTNGENFYLHHRSTRARQLSRLKGVHVECIAWSPSRQSTTTREILVGGQDGSVHEAYIDSSEDSFIQRRGEKYSKLVYKTPDGQAVTGLYYDIVQGRPEVNRVVLTTASAVMHWVGRPHRSSDVGSIFTKFFENEAPSIQDFRDSKAPYSCLAISPESEDDYEPEKAYAWLNSTGIYHGKLLTRPANPELGTHVFSTSTLIQNASMRSTGTPINSIALSHYHILVQRGTSICAINRLNGNTVFESTLDTDSKVLGLCVDPMKSTYWVFTASEIHEIVVTDEDRDLWKIMLQNKSFESATRFAKTPAQKDEVAIVHGDYLVSHGKYREAAAVYGKSSKSFEEVSLIFLENGEHDALRTYLLSKLQSLKKSSIMQRIMVASWLVEIFMSRLNNLEDHLSTIATNVRASATTAAELTAQMDAVKQQYQDFVVKYKPDLDKKTTYDIIGSHGREEELLFYANSINDFSFVLAYWVQREKWLEALNVLKRQSEPDMFYKYSSVLMSNAPMETVDILMRQDYLNPRNLIPALLNYNKFTTAPLSQNQAVRYLQFIIRERGSTDVAVHHTLLGIYAGSSSSDETQLLRYLEEHSGDSQYDADFALRLCIEHGHVQSCVHIYSSMGQYAQAVDLALKHGNVELASIVADRPESDPALRKKLWLAVAQKVIAQSESIKDAVEFLRRCELLKIEDLIPFFPDFVVIDDFKDEICGALEEYSRHIELLKKEMDESARTADHIRLDIASLDRRYTIVEPGERCYICQYPLLARQFFVFPCQHAFHSDCLTGEVVRHSGVGRSRKIEDLQRAIQGGYLGEKRLHAVEELDALIASECILCSEFAIKRIDEPFVSSHDDIAEWAV